VAINDFWNCLHVCELAPKSEEIIATDEGVPLWCDLNKIDELKDKIIPSDYLMIKNFVLEKRCGYYECVMEKIKESCRFFS